MATDLYQRLAQHLDDLPGGFPHTNDGVEIRILRQLFTTEEAELALHLTLIAEEPRVIAHRAGLPVIETIRRLEEMEEKRLIHSTEQDGKPRRYRALQFIVGFWEGQVDRLSREIVEDFEAYLPSLFDHEVWRKTPQMRTIPVNEAIPLELVVMPYEQAEAIVHAQESIAVSNCICRQEFDVLGHGCNKPRETCLSLGTAAEYAVRAGRARAITQEEALGILHKAEQTGLVLQPANAKDPLWICMCCGCCCGVLRSLKRNASPSEIVSSPFVVAHNDDTCIGCGTCETRCQMEAIQVEDHLARINPDRCIGCGLCVTTCPTDSLSLKRKPDSEQPYIPGDIIEASLRLLKARGKMNPGKLIGMQVRSKVDRLFSSP